MLKCKESFKIIEKIHLNRQSGMIFACSLCTFDVVSSVGGSHFFNSAMTIGSVLML